MAKKLFPRALSVGLSLALCAGMVLPSFAAQVLNNENKDQFIDNNGALLGHDGNGGSGDQYDYELGENLELEKALIIKDGVDASLDLKGNDLVHTGKTGSVVKIEKNGELTLKDETAHVETAEDGTETYVSGSVTGGKGNTTGTPTTKGGGIFNEGTLYIEGGSVNNNTAKWGAGVYNNTSGVTVMSGGQISDNKGNYGGGVYSGGQFTMENDAAIIGNTTTGDGGGVYNSGEFVMINGKINGNTSGFDGGGMYMTGDWNPQKKASFVMHDGEIADNTAINENGRGTGGVTLDVGSTFIMHGGEIVRNTSEAKVSGPNGVYGIEGRDHRIEIDYGNVTICNYGKDGVETKHEFDGGKATDAGAAGHTVNCVHGCGQPSNVMLHTYGAWVTVNAPQVGVAGERRHTCTACGHAETEPIAPLTDDNDDDITLTDAEIPLAGIFTRGDAIGYLWRQAGEPEWELSDFADVPEDHEWAVAIGWAQDMGIARADEEGNFRPDDLVLRSVESLEISPEGELQEFLNWYAAYAGVELDEGELFIELVGAWDDVIMGEDAQVIFDEFFAKLEAALSQAA